MFEFQFCSVMSIDSEETYRNIFNVDVSARVKSRVQSDPMCNLRTTVRMHNNFFIEHFYILYI